MHGNAWKYADGVVRLHQEQKTIPKEKEIRTMTYEIKWKKHNRIYTDYKDMEGTKFLLEFLEHNSGNGFELVSIKPYEED